MRIVTRPDFDGIVCSVLLYEALDVKEPVKWAEPNEMQKGLIDIQTGDIIANLPYNENCALWFDHHITNRVDKPFKGAFQIAPSAARIIFEYYKNAYKRDYSELINKTDRIDSANLTLDEILHPEKYAYVLISMTIESREKPVEPYCDKLVELLKKYDISDVCEDPEVIKQCMATIEQNKTYRVLLEEHTRLREHVSITDFRSFEKTPSGNRFLVYSLFPETVVNIKIHYDSKDKEKIRVHVGHSIFNRNCNVNVGLMLSEFEGGGHRGAGGCRFHVKDFEENFHKIIDILLKNERNE